MDEAGLKSLAVALVVIAVLGATYLLVIDNLDKCLDAGGSWRKEINECIYAEDPIKGGQA